MPHDETVKRVAEAIYNAKLAISPVSSRPRIMYLAEAAIAAVFETLSVTPEMLQAMRWERTADCMGLHNCRETGCLEERQLEAALATLRGDTE